jgi:hypothetical protein
VSVAKLQPNGAAVAGFGPVVVNNSWADEPWDAMWLAVVAPDNVGGCWIGGSFDSVNGLRSDGLAHVDAAGNVTVQPRLHPHQDAVDFLARAPDGVIVVERASIYEVLDSGGFKLIDSAGSAWTQVQTAAYSPKYGLVIAATTSTVMRCFAYDPSGNRSTSFGSQVGFVRGPFALAWDQCGRVLVSGTQLANYQGGPVSDAYGVKRLLYNGSLDPLWNQALNFAGGAQRAIALSDSVIVSGPFQSIDGFPYSGTVKLSGEDKSSRLANQSALGWVRGGTEQMTLGIIIQGDYLVQALVRACGPSLAQFGIPKTPAQTTLQIFDANGLLHSVLPGSLPTPHGYAEAPSVTAVTLASGAFPFMTKGWDEAETLVTLAPGAYTVTIDAPTGQNGQVLGEVYYP